jgi:hypothetical protein
MRPFATGAAIVENLSRPYGPSTSALASSAPIEGYGTFTNEEMVGEVHGS